MQIWKSWVYKTGTAICCGMFLCSLAIINTRPKASIKPAQALKRNISNQPLLPSVSIPETSLPTNLVREHRPYTSPHGSYCTCSTKVALSHDSLSTRRIRHTPVIPLVVQVAHRLNSVQYVAHRRPRRRPCLHPGTGYQAILGDAHNAQRGPVIRASPIPATAHRRPDPER